MASLPPASLKKTPLAETHQEWGGRMVEFGGWWMPVQYGGILEEHKAVRSAAGLFDISHMGEIMVTGEEVGSWLNRLLANDLGRLAPGEGQYTFLLNERGGVIDDLIVYRLTASQYLLVVNASKIEEGVAWLTSHLPASGVRLENRSEQMSVLALQGPQAERIYREFFGPKFLPPARNQITVLPWDDLEILAARTGYTGEDGFEFFFSNRGARVLWDGLLKCGEKFGLKPCGLGARDTLRLEVCYPLNGQELSPEHTPLEAGLGFFVSLDKLSDYPGKGALLAQKKEGKPRQLVAFRMTSKGAPPRPHYAVWAGTEKIGEVTSGTLSPSLQTGIGLAYVLAPFAKVGREIEIEVRGQRFPAEIVKKPFYQRIQKS
jgi:aminomethyltransferase